MKTINKEQAKQKKLSDKIKDLKLNLKNITESRNYYKNFFDCYFDEPQISGIPNGDTISDTD